MLANCLKPLTHYPRIKSIFVTLTRMKKLKESPKQNVLSNFIAAGEPFCVGVLF